LGQPLLEAELPGIFHYAAEGRHGSSPGVTAVADTDGVVHSSPAAVEAVILPYFEALFNGRHHSAADRPKPYDSGQSFLPDLDKIPGFLDGLPTLPEEQADALEVPFTYPELAVAVVGAWAAGAPGQDGLPYEFYKTVLAIIGPQLLKVFNQMLQVGSMVASMRSGVVRLIPKAQGVPTAAQFRPITLLGADFKILTNMFVGRLMDVLPTLLQAGQLCSVRGRSIFDGAFSLLSAVEYLHQKQIPGYVISLDFFHAYDRVDLAWVDRVLAAYGFGRMWRRWIRLLHADASDRFMLHTLSQPLAITFSLRQGDPLAMLLYIIQLHPLIVQLRRILAGLSVGNIRESALGYVDDVHALSSSLEDLPKIDEIVADFEAVSGALLNRNRKSVIVGLGSWAGRHEWPLPWIGTDT
jgi:Reverse transcriptase (RNA-dependent DNA polymerase)